MTNPKTYICCHTPSPPSLDGTLLSPAWALAPWTDFFVDIEGDLKPAPPLQTRVKMLWDDECFYLGAQLQEPQVWGTLTQRDSIIFQDNDFEVFIDPDGDNHNYIELEINALGTVWDLRLPKPYRDKGSAMSDWAIEGLRTAVHVDGTLGNPSALSRGWSVEIAIPWSALSEQAKCPTPPREGDQWRVNFSRVEWDVRVENNAFVKIPDRAEHNWVWSPQSVIDMHQPERWGYVQFSRAALDSTAWVPDASAPARDRLMRLYHAQRAHCDTTGRYAATLGELQFTAPPPAEEIVLQSDGEEFEASTTYRSHQGELRRLHVRTDSLLWHS